VAAAVLALLTLSPPTTVLAAGTDAGVTVDGATGPTSGARPGWAAPVPDALVAPFDPPARRWLPGHRGVDLAVSAGAVVAAPASGTITFAGPVGGRPVVVVDHGALRSTLEPVLPSAPVGSTVSRGDVVGHVDDDATLSHCAPEHCLHWGVRRGEAYLDPMALLGGAPPIVLLPVP